MSSMPSNNLYNHHRQVLMYFLSKYSYIEWLSCFLFLARCFQRRFLEGDTQKRNRWPSSDELRVGCETPSRAYKRQAAARPAAMSPLMPLLIKVAAAALQLFLTLALCGDQRSVLRTFHTSQFIANAANAVPTRFYSHLGNRPSSE